MIRENEIDWNVFTTEQRAAIQQKLDNNELDTIEECLPANLPDNARNLGLARAEQVLKIKALHPKKVEKVEKKIEKPKVKKLKK